ncbi:hypothetical protein [Methylobacterium nigriterrae]|uniref:hypothetical protein n=1 Tax=Methylobacterium nigriterrae TaxID=3127512 RepID=UPI00301351B2
MSKHQKIIATALFLTFANLGQAGAAEASSTDRARQGFDVLTVVGAAYHDARVATNAAEVRRQGGFATAGAVQWRIEDDRSIQGAVFDVPSVIGAAYHDARVATNPAEVRRRGGLATATAVRWLPSAPAATEAKSHRVRVGTL